MLWHDKSVKLKVGSTSPPKIRLPFGNATEPFAKTSPRSTPTADIHNERGTSARYDDAKFVWHHYCWTNILAAALAALPNQAILVAMPTIFSLL